MNLTALEIIEVQVDDSRHLRGFVTVYKEAFAKPPYNETYTFEQVRDDVWSPHLADGCIVLALNSDQVIGLGCAMPIDKWKHDKEFQGFISSQRDSLPLDLAKTCFMTEVAVLPDHWRQGIGTRLVQSRIEWAKRGKMSFYMMRTAANGSNSISMYSKLGAQVIEGVVQNVSKHADEVQSTSKQRVYLYGSVD